MKRRKVEPAAGTLEYLYGVGSGVRIALLLLTVSCCSAGTEANPPPSLDAPAASERYRLEKISENNRVGVYNSELDRYDIDLPRLFREGFRLSIPPEVQRRLQTLARDNPRRLVFEGNYLLPSYYDSRWTDKKSIVYLESFQKTILDSDFTSYFGLDIIPTHWEGIGSFVLRFNGDNIRFRTYAQRFIFRIPYRYAAYIEVYLPPKQFRTEIDCLFLSVSNPNALRRHNGLYLLYTAAWLKEKGAGPGGK